MAKMMTSFQVGLFAGAELTDYPHDNLNLERWFRLPKSHERRIHGHHHAGIRILRVRSNADSDARCSRSASRRFHRRRPRRIRHGDRSRKPARISAAARRHEKSPLRKKANNTPESTGRQDPQTP